MPNNSSKTHKTEYYENSHEITLVSHGDLHIDHVNLILAYT